MLAYLFANHDHKSSHGVLMAASALDKDSEPPAVVLYLTYHTVQQEPPFNSSDSEHNCSICDYQRIWQRHREQEQRS